MLVTRVRIFCTTLFTNNIKIVIKSHTFLFHPDSFVIESKDKKGKCIKYAYDNEISELEIDYRS